ncbi:MAG: serine hydroxymethyltransferase [bacterium]|nr:serine hydroxymethyltransferase [bacterium]
MKRLWEVDAEVAEAIYNEIEREAGRLELIASENFVSTAVLEAQGCVMTNKYAEGYPGRRYYGGCSYVDKVENLAIERAKELFGDVHVNVQPHSGTQANMAVYLAVLQPGDTILGMDLSHGGHLTHGARVNFSGRLFNVISYGVSKDTQTIDFSELKDLTEKYKPKMIIAGASAYPRIIDFEKFKEVADLVSAYLVADIAHIAGLIVSGLHPSPIPFCDFTTTTTHKTLRGPRGGVIMCKKEYAKLIDRMVFPGIQGGPLMHVIAAKAVCFREALTSEFKEYQLQVVKNARSLAKALIDLEFTLVSGGTDNHLILVDLRNKGITGLDAEIALDKAGIIVNKNTIPYDKRSPFVTSGIRLGTPALTTRGMKEKEMEKIAQMIGRVLENIDREEVIQEVSHEVKELCDRFPLYQELLER